MQLLNLCFVHFVICLFGSVATIEFTQSGNGYHNPNGFVKFSIKCYNHIPDQIKAEEKDETYEKKLKTYLNQKCYYDAKEFFEGNMFWDPAKVTPESLRKLYLSIYDNSGQVAAYNYYNVKKLVDHPDFDLKKQTFIWIGSYMDVNSLTLGEAMGRLYKRLGYNVLFLHFLQAHWRNLLTSSVARLMRPIGKHSGEMLANLTSVGLDPKKVHLVGYGLGGQAMSFVAKTYRQITGRNISLLVGLDPAGPCFRTKGPHERLDPSDADFVLSVATNIDGHGIATPVGHATFYVNGGEYQPFDMWYIPCDIVCSHVRAYVYWAAMLMNPQIKFIGMKCDSIQQARQQECYDRKPLETNTMDLEVDRSKPGIYYVATFHRYPYALGKAGLRREENPIFNTHKLMNGADVLRVDGI